MIFQKIDFAIWSSRTITTNRCIQKYLKREIYFIIIDIQIGKTANSRAEI